MNNRPFRSLAVAMLVAALAAPAPAADILRDDPAYSIREAARTPLPAYHPSPRDWRDEVLYHLLTDRFENGNPANDRAHPRANVDSKSPGGVHGGDFDGIRQRLPYLKELGVTAVWISPVHMNGRGQYHGYHAADFWRIDPKWGTIEDLRTLTREAHASGIRVIIDIVCNHMDDYITYDNGGHRGYTDDDTRPPRWHDAARTYAPPFNDPALFHTNGNIDFGRRETWLKGEFSSLDDLKTELPAVRENLIRAMCDLITATDCDGFRVDTVKYVDREFWAEWCPAVKEHARSLGKSDFLIFGEAWDSDIALLNTYLADEEGAPLFDSLLDFHGHSGIGGVWAGNDQGPARLRALLAESDGGLAAHARGRLVRFIDNHDMPRFLAMDRKRQPDRAKRLAALRMALVWIMATPGVPSIYYGTEQGFSGLPGTSWDASREDMFDGAFEQGTSEGDSFDTTHEMFRFVRDLARLRAAHPAMRRGSVTFNVAEATPGVLIATVREGGDIVRLIMNTHEKESRSLPAHPLAEGGTWLVDDAAVALTNIRSPADALHAAMRLRPLGPQEFLILATEPPR